MSILDEVRALVDAPLHLDACGSLGGRCPVDDECPCHLAPLDDVALAADRADA